MFTTRLISGIVLVIIAAFLLVEGSTVLYFGSMAISLIGLYELYRVMKIERSAPGFVGYAAVVAYYWRIAFNNSSLLKSGHRHSVT